MQLDIIDRFCWKKFKRSRSSGYGDILNWNMSTWWHFLSCMS